MKLHGQSGTIATKERELVGTERFDSTVQVLGCRMLKGGCIRLVQAYAVLTCGMPPRRSGANEANTEGTNALCSSTTSAGLLVILNEFSAIRAKMGLSYVFIRQDITQKEQNTKPNQQRHLGCRVFIANLETAVLNTVHIFHCGGFLLNQIV
jgi:hypothetical protein